MSPPCHYPPENGAPLCCQFSQPRQHVLLSVSNVSKIYGPARIFGLLTRGMQLPLGKIVNPSPAGGLEEVGGGWSGLKGVGVSGEIL